MRAVAIAVLVAWVLQSAAFAQSTRAAPEATFAIQTKPVALPALSVARLNDQASADSRKALEASAQRNRELMASVERNLKQNAEAKARLDALLECQRKNGPKHVCR